MELYLFYLMQSVGCLRKKLMMILLYVGESTSFDMLSTYANKTIFQRYFLFIPMSFSIDNLCKFRLGDGDKTIIAFALEEAKEGAIYIVERIPPALGDDSHLRCVLHSLRLKRLGTLLFIAVTDKASGIEEKYDL